MFVFRLAFWFARFGVKLVLALALLGTIVLVLYATFWLPDVAFLSENPPETTAFIERARSAYREEGKNVRIRRSWAALDRISPHLTTAVRVAEDDRFYLHNGFDFTEIKNSFERNLKEGRWARGGSTLTQQLAKNLYLSPEKTLRRKFDEMLLTWKLEKTLTKDRILELYLNVAEWGHGCYGAEAASRFYFSKPASKLTQREAANLAARLPNPGYYSSHSGEKKRRAREKTILARMKKSGPAPGKADRAIQEKRERVKDPAPRRRPSSTKEAETLGMIAEVTRRIDPLRKKLAEVFTEPETVEVEREKLDSRFRGNDDEGSGNDDEGSGNDNEGSGNVDRGSGNDNGGDGNDGLSLWKVARETAKKVTGSRAAPKVESPRQDRRIDPTRPPASPRVTVQGPEAVPVEPARDDNEFKPLPPNPAPVRRKSANRSRSNSVSEQLARLRKVLSD